MSTKEALENWHKATPDASDDEGLSSDGSTSYESKELTLRPLKRPRGEEEDDPDFDSKGEARGSHTEPRVPPKDDTKDLRHEVRR
jgi:hypothetical protein